MLVTIVKHHLDNTCLDNPQATTIIILNFSCK